MPVGAGAEAGGSPGQVLRPRRPGQEEEADILQLEGQRALARVSAGELRWCPLAQKAVHRGS